MFVNLLLESTAEERVIEVVEAMVVNSVLWSDSGI